MTSSLLLDPCALTRARDARGGTLMLGAGNQAFDGVLAESARRTGTRHVDGEPRRDGVRDFLHAWGVDAPPAGWGARRGSDRCTAG